MTTGYVPAGERDKGGAKKPVSPWKKVAAIIATISAVVGIVVGIQQLMKPDAAPANNTSSTSTNSGNTYNSTPIYYTEVHPASEQTQQAAVYGSVMAPAGYAAVYAYSYPSESMGWQITDQVASGASLQLICSAIGDTVTGDYGTSSLWYATDYGYIPDAYLNTGSMQAVAPSCTG